MAIDKLPTLALESNAITADLIAAGAITAADISDGEITAAKLHTTLDFSTKTFTMHNNHVTQAMVTQHQAALSLTQSQISDLSTTNLTEGTNLYYTDARADARAQLKIDALVDSAPGTLDTLNELAAALGDDANFSTTVTNSIATKLPLAGGTLTGALDVQSTVTADGLTVQSNNNLDIHDADNHVSGRLRNVSGSNNALAIEADPNNSASDSFINFKIDTSEKMRITSSGNVGIGTLSPSFESGTGTGLEIRNAGGNGAHVKLTDTASGAGGTNGFDLYAFNTSGYIENYEAGSIVFRNNGSERMRIDSSGRLGIATGGVVNTNAHANADDLVIGNTSNRTGMTIVSDPAQNGNIHFSDGTSTGNANIKGQFTYEHSDNSFRFYVNSTTEVLRLTSSGGTVFNNGQDINQNFTVKASGNANALFIDGNGGNVGIGDGNPTSLLSISKNSTRTTDFENMLKITHTSSGTTGVGFGSAIYFLGERENGALQAMGRLLFDAEVNSGTNISSGFSVQTATAGSTSEKFRITHDGKVGIGTPGPSQKLEVAGNIEADGYFGDGGATSNITFSQATSTSNPSVALWGRDHSSYPGQVHIVGRNSNSNTSSGDIRLWNYNGSTWYNMFRFAYDTDNSDTRTTLQTITDTNTAIVSTQSIYNIIDSNNNQTDRAFFVSCNSDRPGNATTIIKAGEDRNIVFGQNDAGGMYNGTGSNGFGVQQAGLGAQYVVVQNTTDSNLYLSKHSSYSDSRCIQFSIGGTTKGSVTVASSGTTYNTTSDLRLKTDIKPIKNATSKLLEMNPVEHKWKADPEDDAVHGFIAQEMKEIIPEAVYGEPDGDEMMSMDYGRITPVIVAALQNALKEIDELKTRISELESKQ